MKDLPKLVASVVLCELVGIVSTPFTLLAIPSWYRTLVKPPFSPPNWIFGPVWTLLYFLMGISFYLIWKKSSKGEKVRSAKIVFIAQLIFNFLWSLVFFGLRSPVLGLGVIVTLWILILVTMRAFRPLSKPAFYLLVPYIAWVSFAAILNIAIVILN